jgi:hypothetical protein
MLYKALLMGLSNDVYFDPSYYFSNIQWCSNMELIGKARKEQFCNLGT